MVKKITQRRFWLIWCLVLILVGLQGRSVSAVAVDVRVVGEVKELEAFLDGIITTRMDERNITGTTVAVVKDGEVLLSKGYGYTDLDKLELVDPDRTLFRTGSTSKLITWTALMQLVEQKELDLEKNVNAYLDFQIPSRLLDGSEAEYITPAHLLTHTPGFEDVGTGLFVTSPQEMTSLKKYLLQNKPARVFPPGEVMAYSNYGTALAGYLVERISGQPFEKYVQENIFAPLDMEYSTFRQPLPENLAPQLIQAYHYSGGEYHKGGFEYISGLPAGSMSSTASDMANFMLFHLQKGGFGNEQILQEETILQMHRQQFSHHPKADGMTYGFIEDTFNGKRAITHGGNTQLFHTGLFLVPEQGLGFFISSAGRDIGREQVFQAFMDRYYPDESSSELKPPAKTRKRVANYLGEYRPNRANFSTFENLLRVMSPIQVDMNKEGYLKTNLYGETVQLVEEEAGVFRERYPDGLQMIGTLTFHEGTDGTILMAPDGPMTYSKTPWYGTIAFIGLLIGAALLLPAGSAVGWGISWAKRRFQQQTNSGRLPLGPETFARVAAAAFGLLTAIFLMGLLFIFTDIDPSYGAPRIFYGLTPLAGFVLSLPWPLAILGATMVVFTAVSWYKDYWTLGGRLHYTLISAAALGLVWVMAYSNLF